MPDVRAILNERRNQHGRLTDHARVCQAMKRAMRDSLGWELLADDMKEAADMIVHKLARTLSGNPNYIEHYRDIAGYAQLVVDRLQETDGAIDSVTVMKRREAGEWVEGGMEGQHG